MPINGDYLIPDCPTDCESADLPAVSFASCGQAILSHQSEIDWVFMTKEVLDETTGDYTHGPTDWTSAAAWATVLDDALAGGVRGLRVMGSLAAAEREIRELSQGRQKSGIGTYTLSAVVDDLSDENYEFCRNLEACGGTYRIWYSVRGGFMYGGANGIRVNITNVDMPLESGSNSYATATINMVWESFASPERIVNPLAQ